MSDCDLDSSVPDWVIEHPETLVVFQELGIDTSCGGKSLGYACHQQGLDEEAILKRLFGCLHAQGEDSAADGEG
jgi:iron-sulfur cluster repair protein YtfE (RIC family)